MKFKDKTGRVYLSEGFPEDSRIMKEGLVPVYSDGLLSPYEEMPSITEFIPRVYVKEEKTMESQSRYGIMEELNTKKLATKQEISKLEENKEIEERRKQEEIDNMKNQIVATEGVYKFNHLQWKSGKESDIRIKTLQHKKEIENLDEEIKTRDSSYESDFRNWKENQKTRIEALSKTLDEFKKSSKRQIESKQEILKEIDIGMKNLKEMSKEQKEK